MKIISTKVHGGLDYLMGIVLIAIPWLLNFYRGGAETWVPVVLGVGVILYSLLTNYEYSFSDAIPMPAHLTRDVLSGIFLAMSPWLYGFNDVVFLPHLILGSVQVAVGLISEAIPRSAEYPST